MEKGKDYPDFYQERSLSTVTKGYLLEGETPRDMYRRLAKSASTYLKMPELEESFFEIMWKGWLGPASPVMSNLGTDRGLPISCFSERVPDSIDGIYKSVHEMAMLTKHGGGVGFYVGKIRGRGETIKGNGQSEGVVPWLKVFDSAILATSQGSTRRGAAAAYIDIEHPDAEEFLRIRRPEGDINRQCMNLHHAVSVSDNFMKAIKRGDKKKRKLWEQVLSNRLETGDPYILFKDNVNKVNPEAYKKNKLLVETSNICCLSGDTEVLTSKGFSKIKDLVSKKVRIYDGSEWVSNDSFELKGEDYLYRITLKDGSFVDCTANHRWFVSENYTQISNNKVKELTTKDLSIGTWLEFHKQEVHGNIKEEAAYLKGFLIGDGTQTKGRPILNVHSTKYSCIGQLIESANEITKTQFNTNSKKEIKFSEEVDNTGKYNTYGIQRFVKMEGLAGRKEELTKWVTEYKKCLPTNCIEWTKETKLSFLAGLFDADGTIGKHYSMQITSIHHNFLMDLQRLLKSMGIWSGIDKGKTTFRLTLNSSDSYVLLHSAPFRRLHFEGKKPNRITTGWRKIASIEKLEGKHKVYCPRVPSTGKFALANGLMTGNSEITLYTDDDHTFVCCLSSLNLEKFSEWEKWKSKEGYSVPFLSTLFLDGVLEEFIDKAKDKPGFERSVRSAVKGRALGLGVMGWHSFLQKNRLPFGSFGAKVQNRGIFSFINREAKEASKYLAQVKGEPEWCQGTGMRNSHLIALAPTVTNATICGGVSPSIEPWAANAFNQKTAKGTFIVKNSELELLLKEKGQNNKQVWDSIVANNGSVLHLDFLTMEEKEVFLTAKEIDQMDLINQAADRYPYIDQAQSLNLFFELPQEDSEKIEFVRYFNNVHIKAWELGIKSLYYVRSNSILNKATDQSVLRKIRQKIQNDCTACEG